MVRAKPLVYVLAVILAAGYLALFWVTSDPPHVALVVDRSRMIIQILACSGVIAAGLLVQLSSRSLWRLSMAAPVFAAAAILLDPGPMHIQSFGDAIEASIVLALPVAMTAAVFSVAAVLAGSSRLAVLLCATTGLAAGYVTTKALPFLSLFYHCGVMGDCP